MEEKQWTGKHILITGVCGTVGKELLRQIVGTRPGEVIGVDNNEGEVFFTGEEYHAHSNVRIYLGDLRDGDRLSYLMRGIDIVLHAAALKNVIVCERSPQDAIQTNVQGMQNVIDAANYNHVERVLFTSSDKAVNPTNVMGTSKLMGERLITAANAYRQNGRPIFASTRFGNVLGSRGSVIPLFKRQIARGGPVTLTDPRMTRFIMTLSQAVRLVMNSAFLAEGGEVFITKMPVACISDLASVMIEELAQKSGHSPKSIEVQVVGSLPGEKLHEELMNEEETRRTVELDRYFVVLPAFKSVYDRIDYAYTRNSPAGVDKPYNSATEKPMSREDLRVYLISNGLLEVD